LHVPSMSVARAAVPGAPESRLGLFSRELTFWFLPRRSVRNSVLGEAWHRLRQVRNEPLPATLPYTWSAKGRQDFGTIANDDATGGQIHCNVSAGACRRWKNNAVDTLRNPDVSQFLRNIIPRPT
jgi:hypothetical protein